MSGQQIGTVVGGIVGSFIPVVGTAMGMAIGGMIGGAVDPTKIQGPRLGDASVQTSRDGVPIPWGYGTFPTTGNCIWQGPVVEHRSVDDGKGSGTEITNYTYTRSYAIGICEGPITGLLQIKRNAKIVYDARTDEVMTAAGMTSAEISSARAGNAKFLEKCTVYLGDETQMPDPTIEAQEGAGNVSPFRGLAYIVMDADETGAGEVAQFEFVVAVDGTIQVDAGEYEPKWFGQKSPWKETAPNVVDPREAGMSYEYAHVAHGLAFNDAAITWRDSVDAALADAATATGRAAIETPILMGWGLNFDASPGGTMAPYDDVSGEDWDDRYALGLNYSRYSDEKETTGITLEPLACGNFVDPVWGHKIVYVPTGNVLHRNATIQNTADGPAGYDLQDNCDDGGGPLVPQYNIYTGYTIACRPMVGCVSSVPFDAVELPDSPGFYTDSNGDVYGDTSCASVVGTFKQLSVLRGTTDGDVTVARILTSPFGPVLDSAHADYSNQTYWDAQYADAVTAGDLPAGMTYSSTGTGAATTYPVATGSACECVPVTDIVTPAGVVLSTIVADICDREGIDSAQYDVSQLTDVVLGYRIANEGSADAMIQPLQSAYFFDVAEWDGKLRFVKRGGASIMSLDMDDLAERDGDAIEQQRVQEAELLRRVTVAYLDPAANYTPATQKWERRIGTVQAKGEATVEIPVVGTADFAATVGAKRGKVGWSETDTFKQSLPYRLAALTPTDVITLTDSQSKAHRIRLMGIEDDSGVRLTEATLDRAEVYTATTATGLAPTPPTLPPTTLRGPTNFIAMNLPQLRTQDSTPGMHIAANGTMAGWPGCVVQLSVDAGESYQNVKTIINPATMGALTTGYGPTDGTVYAWVRGGQLSSATAAQIDARANAFAIVGDGDVAEVGQFVNASPGPTNGTVYNYTLTGISHGQLDTVAADHEQAEPFVLLDGAVLFLPIDVSHAGKTLIFRAVTAGSLPENNPTFSVVYEPPTYIRHGGVVTP